MSVKSFGVEGCWEGFGGPHAALKDPLNGEPERKLGGPDMEQGVLERRLGEPKWMPLGHLRLMCEIL